MRQLVCVNATPSQTIGNHPNSLFASGKKLSCSEAPTRNVEYTGRGELYIVQPGQYFSNVNHFFILSQEESFALNFNYYWLFLYINHLPVTMQVIYNCLCAFISFVET